MTTNDAKKVSVIKLGFTISLEALSFNVVLKILLLD
ncbi:MAG: hypothetical protein ACI8RD_002252 [Bacillariaceae sp.]|jgi:hypothetical protein